MPKPLKPPKPAQTPMTWTQSSVTPLEPGGPPPGGSSAGPTTGGGFTNTAEMDPTLMEHLGRLRKRLDDPEGSTGRAIDRAGSKIRDAAEGTMGVMRNTLSKRGALAGTNAGDLLTRDILTKSQSDIADTAAGISLERERDNDSFLMGSTGAFAMPGQNARADRSQAFSEYMGHNQLAQQAEQNRLAQLLQTFNLAQQYL
jgi:hypothetical protein